MSSPSKIVMPWEATGAIYAFVCPLCGNHFKWEAPMEPLCTGPSMSRDEHEPTPMQRVFD